MPNINTPVSHPDDITFPDDFNTNCLGPLAELAQFGESMTLTEATARCGLSIMTRCLKLDEAIPLSDLGTWYITGTVISTAGSFKWNIQEVGTPNLPIHMTHVSHRKDVLSPRRTVLSTTDGNVHSMSPGNGGWIFGLVGPN